MATANTALNRPRGPALNPPQTPPGTTTHHHATTNTSHILRALVYTAKINYRILLRFTLSNTQLVVPYLPFHHHPGRITSPDILFINDCIVDFGSEIHRQRHPAFIKLFISPLSTIRLVHIIWTATFISTVYPTRTSVSFTIHSWQVQVQPYSFSILSAYRFHALLIYYFWRF